MAMGLKGKLITFEGSEGSGKSTQIQLMCNYLKKKKLPVMVLREPGGVNISEQVREILLDVRNKNMGSACETLLYMASRAQLVEEQILPALKKGKIVLCDRFLDSTLAYQGYGNGVDLFFIKEVGRFATQGIAPCLTFIFDIDARAGLNRIKRAKDRIELKALEYHNRVRRGYRAIAHQEPDRVRLVEVNRSKEEIHEIVKRHVNVCLGLKD
jgi:dTMP kinase